MLLRYENIIQIRCLLEGVSVDEMLNTWEHMLPAKMAEWKLQRAEVRAGSCMHRGRTCTSSAPGFSVARWLDSLIPML